MKSNERLDEIEGKWTHSKMDYTDIRWLIDRAKRLTEELEQMPATMYFALLETTAWMGIPEKNREKCISEHVSNIKFIVNKVLEGEE
jgi:hypothetical protein